MIWIAVCDDNKTESRAAKSLLLSYTARQTDTAFNIIEYNSSAGLLAALKTGHSFQIYLLDILMPGRSGIDLGREIHASNPSAFIIYLSSSPDYALDAFHVYAFQYLLKPVTGEKLFPVMDKVLALLKDTDFNCFLLKSKSGTVRLTCSKIQHVEYLNHQIAVFMEDGSIYTSITLRDKFDDIVKDLAEFPFFLKPHKSFLVNMNYVQTLQEHDFTMRDSTLIPISRGNYAAVKKQYIDFVLNKGYGGISNEL